VFELAAMPLLTPFCLFILFIPVLLFTFSLCLLMPLRHAVYDFHFFHNGYQTKRNSGMSYQGFINDLSLSE
jgi:hypothetical protein